MKLSGHIILVTLTVVSALLVAFLGVHVILSVATLYSLSFITQFNFLQIYGFWVIIGILSYKYKKSEKATTTPYEDAFSGLFSLSIYYLLAWGMAFLIFSFLN